jgi:hypothetical protein
MGLAHYLFAGGVCMSLQLLPLLAVMVWGALKVVVDVLPDGLGLGVPVNPSFIVRDNSL